MKKYVIYTLAAGLLLSSCGTMNKSDAVFTGATIGGSLGSNIGGLVGGNRHGWRGEFRGSAIGSIIGTLAGAALGGAINSANKENKTYSAENEQSCGTAYERNTSSLNLDGLRIHNIRFVDSDKDHEISSKENCQVIFEVMNEGSNTAYNVVPTVQTDNRKISVSPSVMIEQIAPGDGIKYTAYLKAGNKLKTGQVTIHLAIADDLGKEYATQEFTLPVKR